MPVSLDQLLRLADAPAAVLLVVLVALILVGSLRRWWVPVWIYDREVLRGDRNDEALVKATAALLKVEQRLERVEGRVDDALWDRRERHAVGRADDS